MDYFLTYLQKEFSQDIFQQPYSAWFYILC